MLRLLSRPLICWMIVRLGKKFVWVPSMGMQSVEGMRRFSTVRRCRVDILEIVAKVMDKFETMARLCLRTFSRAAVVKVNLVYNFQYNQAAVFSSDNCTDKVGVISETCFYTFNDSSVENNALKRHAEIQTIGGVVAMNTGTCLVR